MGKRAQYCVFYLFKFRVPEKLSPGLKDVKFDAPGENLSLAF
jgi:hypothetical protein